MHVRRVLFRSAAGHWPPLKRGSTCAIANARQSLQQRRPGAVGFVARSYRMRVALSEHVPYLEVRRRGRKAYFYFRPKGSAAAILGMHIVALAVKAPRTATYEERLKIAISEAKQLNTELAHRRQRSKCDDPASIKGTLPWLMAERRKHENYINLSEATKER